MSDALTRWNALPEAEAFAEILACCGSRVWASAMVGSRPFPDEVTLQATSNQVWNGLAEPDWMEALHSHPRIGESRPSDTNVKAVNWSAQEQKGVADDGDAVRSVLAEANREYERRFGHIFVVCATGKSGAEILEILRRRLQNDKATELREAAEQVRQITQIRLQKWMAE